MTQPNDSAASRNVRQTHDDSAGVEPNSTTGGSPHAPLSRLLRIVRGVRSIIAARGGIGATYSYCKSIVQREGLSGLRNRLSRVTADQTPDELYSDWIARYDSIDESIRATIRQSIDVLPARPLISLVVPTYQTPEPYLRAMIDSVRAQIYPHWELCIADDASPDPTVRRVLEEYAALDERIRFVVRTDNGHISAASNSALELVHGEYVALLDHDDTLPEHALYVVARYIGSHPQAKLFYSDEDKLMPDGSRSTPYFKCDWNPELILGQNMFSHFGVYQTALLREVGGFRIGLEGSQDHDLILRCVERAGHASVVHIPHVLYHWRVIPGSTATRVEEKPYALQASIEAVSQHLHRRGIEAEVAPAFAGTHMLRVKYPAPDVPPLVSIIIPTRDGMTLLRQCIDSVFGKTTYPAFEIIIVDNGSVEPATFAYFEELLQRGNVRVLRDERPFNFSALNNLAAAEARGTYLCLLNNDIEVISPDWLDEMMSHAVRPENGAIGASLWYPDDTLQHGGVLVGIADLAGHMHHRLWKGNAGYFGRGALTQNVSAVTAACLVVRKSLYDEVGGFNEALAVAFNDVDFCLRVRNAGYRNVYTPFARLYHHESATRGTDVRPEVRARFESEIELMKRTWGSDIRLDPFYNPNLASHDAPLFTPAFPPRIGQLD
jgi:O-antigen biosynthesis protein